MRVGIFLPDLRGGGAERSLLNVANGLARRGHDVEIVLAKSGGALRELVSPAVSVHELSAKTTLASIPRLAKRMREQSYDAMVSGMDHANVAALTANLLTGSKSRSMVTIHNQISVENQNSRRGRAMLAAASKFYRRADSVVAVSQGVRDDAARTFNLPLQKIRVIYNPILTRDFGIEIEPAIPDDWLQTGIPFVLGIGRLEPQKDFANLIRAFSEVPSRYRLAILGEGSERQNLERLAVEFEVADRLHMPGFVSNPIEYLKQASVFALSSKFEGLPTVLIEALAVGTPIVSTDCPSGPMEILEGGTWGSLVPVGDSAALGQAIADALAVDERKKPTAACLNRFEEDFVLNLYESELGVTVG